MKKAILYRFHEGSRFHCERIQVMRHFNPDVPIHVITGGPQPGATQSAVASLVQSFWEHPAEDGDWRWRSGDLIIRDWYAAEGHKHSFDHVYDVEWDVLLTGPIDEIYPKLPTNVLALSGLSELSPNETKWSWTAREPMRTKAIAFFGYMANKFGAGYPKYFCFWPGAVLPRSYLEALQNLSLDDDMPLISEITTPLIAEMLGFRIIDTGLMRRISYSLPSVLMSPFFHADGDAALSRAQVLQVLSEPATLTVPACFHPVKEAVLLTDILDAKIRFSKKPLSHLKASASPFPILPAALPNPH